MASFKALLPTLFSIYVTALDASIQEIERHLEMGKQYLMKGQFANAVAQYHAAVDLDPDNYQTLYLRATCYLAMSKAKQALLDLDKVLSLKPDFTAARQQRGNLLFKYCDLEAAMVDFEKIIHKDKNNIEAKNALAKIAPTRQLLEDANERFEHGDLSSAAQMFSSIIEICPSSVDIHEKRAVCYEALGDIRKAIVDIRSVALLVPDNTDAFYKIASLYYRIGDVEQSLRQIRECLKRDPEHATCFPFYKNVKKIDKHVNKIASSINAESWVDCIDYSKILLKAETKVPAIQLQAKEHLCHCLVKAGQISESMAMCNEVLKAEPTNMDALCNRAEAYLAIDKFDDAIKDYQNVLNNREDNRRAKEGLERAQKLQKQSRKKDYYKILQVRRTASKREIMKAYRKLAQQWHPDNFKDNEKAAAQAKFIDIAAAKEVLTDPEKRAQFDNGEDPLDPEAQQGQHPFAQGFPFGGGGGPFQFKFHFN